ncbi:MAG: lysostaphin resistance A-like protein [Sphingobacteriales bacterium]
MAFLRNKYFIGGLLVYVAAVLYLHFAFEQPLREMFVSFTILGIGFSYIGWWLTKDLSQPYHLPAIKKESWFLLLLVAWIVFYITYGGSLINKSLPASWVENPPIYSIIIFLRKLLFFVLVPFGVYKAFGFSLKDFGLKGSPVKFFSQKSILVFILLSIAALLFQYFLSSGAKGVRSGAFDTAQLLIGLPLCFVYLIFDAGLIEEFFFRGLLQSRLSVLLKSTAGSIVVSAIIFGLVHAPGLYLRGAESEGIEEQLPFTFFAAYTVAYMSVAGIFLGIIYSKTKNLWLVVAIHAMVDLLPNLGDFIHTWGIK